MFNYRDITAYKYQLTEDYGVVIPMYPEADIETDFIWLDTDGGLKVRRGYAWNGTSGPTRDGPTNMRASLIHDPLYQLMNEGLLPQEMRKAADEIFRDICLEDGMCKFRAAVDYRGLRMFGARAARLS